MKENTIDDIKNKVLEILKDKYSAVDLMTINDILGFTTVDELRELQVALEELIDDNIVYLSKKERYILVDYCKDYKTGVIEINKAGNGFLLLDDEPDVFIKRENLNFALDGDTVRVKVDHLDTLKPEGRVIDIIKRNMKNIIGVIKNSGIELYFEPIEKVDINLMIDATSLKDCVEGEIVAATILDDLGKNKFLAEISKHICHKDDATLDVLTIAAKHDIFASFSEESMEQADSLPNEIEGSLLENELESGRVDLRDKVIFTIDGKDTKDIDDAISLEEKDGEFILGVHIADVSHYVTEGSPLDIDAYNKGTSSYLANSVLPMLPHKLSNGICSLNPEVNRCAMSCVMKIGRNGKVKSAEVFPSIIKSRKKMNYTDVNSVIEDDIIPDGYEEFAETLKKMNYLAHLIRDERMNRGASDFDVPEPKIICDDKGIAIDVIKTPRGDAERLIEDFMVAANESVAKKFSSGDFILPAIYRVHDVPKPEKVQAYINFCNMTGKKIVGKFKNVNNPAVFQKLLNQVIEQGDENGVYRALAVRTMPKAFYSKDNIFHFGLASHNYTHFTSPIRRYPDLMVHRLIRTYYINKDTSKRTVDYYNNKLDEIAKQCSEREVLAVEAEREVTKMKMAEYMEQHIGEEFDAFVTGAMKKGIFVQLPNLVEGLVSVESISGDYYEYDESREAIVGTKGHKVYGIGDKLRVVCTSSSKELQQVNFELVKDLKKDDIEEIEPKKKVLK